MIWSKLGISNPELLDAEDPLSQKIVSDYVQKVMMTTPLIPENDNNIINVVNEKKVQELTTKVMIHNNDKQTPRKRQLSESVECFETCKKLRSESEYPPVEQDNIIINMMKQLKNNLNNMGERLEKRISNIESNLERKLTVKFNTVITDRVKGEVDKVRNDINSEIEHVEKLDKTYSEIVSNGVLGNPNITHENPKEAKQTIVVKNLPFDTRENSSDTGLKVKVEALVKDGLKLHNINIRRVVRRKTQTTNTSTCTSSRPGVVFVELDTLDDKKQILQKKENTQRFVEI